MMLTLASASLAAALCQTSPVEKAFSPDKLKELPHLYRQNATLVKCKKTTRELVVISNPIRKKDICIFNELHLDLNYELKAVASVGDESVCPAISFAESNYPGPEWIFTLDHISPQDALQIKNLVLTYGIALLDKESERRKGETRNMYYGTHALTAFSVGMVDMDECRDRVSPIKQMSYMACARVSVYNDTVTGWDMYFAKWLDGTYVFVDSSRNVY